MAMNMTMNLRKKLKEIEKSFKTFAVTDESEKKVSGSQKSAYLYTPGWSIVEAIRQKMDEQNVMLEMNVVDEKHEMISYPVYKQMQNDQILPFEKREMYVTVRCAFNWVDVDTNETIGPIIMTASGANGIDKSISSALSLAERYFLLKYFHITTREKDEEPDAHDCESLPGIPAGQQPTTARDWKGPQGYAPATPQVYQQQTYQGAYLNTQTKPQQENLYENAINTLMNFEAGTKSHADSLNRLLISLNLAGYNTADPTFASNLVNEAQARRMNCGRRP